MNVPLSWLKEYVGYPDGLDPQEFTDRMIMTGSEVEGFEVTGHEITNTVTARLTSVEKHQDSDHLLVCKVDVGGGREYQIVTGAQNVFVGAIVPAALDGAHLPCGKDIKNGVLRGVKSDGMLCSGEELMVDTEKFPKAAEYGIWILDENTPIGVDINDIIGESDVVFDFKTYANRPDCMSMIGIAREVAVTLGTKLTLPEIKVEEKGAGKASDELSVEIKDHELCTRYCARIVKNIRIAPSPTWMQKALVASGVRPINNVVDITNYVMLEQGQPMHAFDRNCVRGGRIVVKRSEETDRFVTLDGKEHELSMRPLCICDNEGIIGLAGIMGGLDSEITEKTSSVVLESAVFKGTALRAASRALGMRTEASARFEKGLSFKGAEVALERAAQLFEMLDAGDVVPGVIDVYDKKPDENGFTFETQRVRELLGVDVSDEDIVDILSKLDFSPREISSGVVSVVAPYWRLDVDGAADIAEEVIRIYGFDKIPSTLMCGEVKGGGRSHKQEVILASKQELAAIGLREISTYSFVTPRYQDMMRVAEDSELRNTLTLLNPLGEDLSVMRTMLLPSMLSCVRLNQSRGNGELALFEVGRVFLSKSKHETEIQPEERTHLCIAMTGRSFFALKGVIERLLEKILVRGVKLTSGGEDMWHPGRKAILKVNGTVIGEMGELHPDVTDSFEITGRVVACELDMERIVELSVDDRVFVQISRNPAVSRDMAVVVDEEIRVGDMLDAIRRSGKGILESASVFDIYRGDHVEDGKKSVAFSIVYRAPDRTLTDDEVKKAFDRAVRSLEAQYGAKLRD